jgi:hypothetical protein
MNYRTFRLSVEPKSKKPWFAKTRAFLFDQLVKYARKRLTDNRQFISSCGTCEGLIVEQP